MAASIGLAKGDVEKLVKIVEAVPELKFLCLDVANGYSEYFVELVKNVRQQFPTHTIMVNIYIYIHIHQ